MEIEGGGAGGKVARVTTRRHAIGGSKSYLVARLIYLQGRGHRRGRTLCPKKRENIKRTGPSTFNDKSDSMNMVLKKNVGRHVGRGSRRANLNTISRPEAVKDTYFKPFLL